MKHIFIIDYYKYDMEFTCRFLHEIKKIAEAKEYEYQIFLANNYQETNFYVTKYSYQPNTIIYTVGDSKTMHAAIQKINPKTPYQHITINHDYINELKEVFNNSLDTQTITLATCNNEHFLSDLTIGNFPKLINQGKRNSHIISHYYHTPKEDLDLSYYPNYQENKTDLKDKSYEYLGFQAINNPLSHLLDISIIPALSNRELIKLAYLYNKDLSTSKYVDHFQSDNLSLYNEKGIDYTIDNLTRHSNHLALTTSSNALTLKKRITK